MNSKNAIQDELRELNNSFPHNKEKPVFDLPQGYFENFAASVLARIKGETEVNAHDELKALSSTLSAIPRPMPFSVPENYFSGLAGNLPALIQDDYVPMELKLSGKKVPYDVPADYFQNLPYLILSKVTKPKAKVVSLSSVKWIRYTAVAVITGVIAVSSVIYFNNKTTDAAQQPGTAWVATELQNVSNKDLEEFISTTDAGFKNKEVAQAPVKNAEVRKLLRDIPDGELEAFLATLPADNEEFSLTN